LNSLAEDMVNEFNDQHKKGFDADGNKGGDFFEPITDSDRAIDQLALTGPISDINDGLDKIAAGLADAIGNGENANALSDIFNQEGDNIESEFRKIVTSVGAESSRAQQMKNNQDVVLKQLNTLDRSVSGVSLDEEMANLIKYQQSYAAAAKYINKTDELLQTLMTIV
jgi:flagellar hook-associated protein 1 FlgK